MRLISSGFSAPKWRVDFGIDMAEHRVLAEGAHAGAIDRFSIRLESGFHHGLSGIMVGHADALAEAVIERVVQIKDHAADERLGCCGALAAL